ncbi:MAG: FAD-binding oxidoreductase [Desulfobacterales bacterium]|nr:FAD-binding oxidoreductase [Desulfobacterales bacterium]
MSIFKEKMVFEENRSIWIENTSGKSPPLKENIEADAAIVGGGYMGLSSGLHIKKLFPEKRVVLLEAKEIGHGASGRNGGMCLTQLSSDYMHVAHPKTHKASYDATLNCVKEIAAMMKKYGMEDGLNEVGSLMVNYSPQKTKYSKKYAGQAADMGIPVEFWDRNKVIDALGTHVYYGGLYDPNSFEIHPSKYVHSLKQAALDAGVEIFEDSCVEHIDEGTVNRLTIKTSEDLIHGVKAKQVVLGMNGYITKLGYMKNRIFPVMIEMASTPALGKGIFEKLGWKNRIGFHDDNNLLFHFGSTHDGRIVFGGGNAEYYFNNGLSYKKDINKPMNMLHKELSRVYPALKNVSFEKIWTGVISLSLNQQQSVGTTGKFNNIYYAVGCMGHGVCQMYFSGKVIADMMSGDIEKWKDMPFFKKKLPLLPPEPLKYLGANAFMTALGVMDKFQMEK